MDEMSITVNGEPRQLTGPLSISALLHALGLDARGVAVERNRAVVPRAQYDQVELHGGDEIEIVRFVGGGCR